MLADAEQAGMSAEELPSELTETVLERALGAELDDHPGAEGDLQLQAPLIGEPALAEPAALVGLE